MQISILNIFLQLYNKITQSAKSFSSNMDWNENEVIQ